MTALVAVIISGTKIPPTGLRVQLTIISGWGTDMMPPASVALVRSYINIAVIVGRGAGGPIGGLLFDLVGWRWSEVAPF